MSTDVERYETRNGLAPADPTGGRLVAWAHAASAAKQLADALCQTTFVPQHFRNKPDDGAAAIMYGDEIGFTPGQSLQNIYVISGKPSLYARAMVALVLSKGHEIWTEASSPQRVIVCGKRKGTNHVERVEWTRAKADQAGYTTNKKYTTDPESMLYARASGDVARRVAPDALAGIAYTVEELELGVGNGTVTVTAETRKRTAKRAQPVPPADEPDLDEQTTKVTQGQTDGQHKKMHALFKEHGINTHEDRVAFATRAIGHTVESTNELDFNETSTVIDWLAKGPAGTVTDPPDNPGFAGEQPALGDQP
jgi:hypothetical protein